MAKLNKKLFFNGWILLALILVVRVAGSLYYTPFIEGYKNNSEQPYCKIVIEPKLQKARKLLNKYY